MKTNNCMRRAYLFILASLVALVASAAGPNGSATYYQNADGKKGSALKTALCGIIYNRTEKSYDYLWTAFYTTDVCDGDKVWDMYSNKTKLTLGTNQDSGNGNAEGQYYNREHSFPASWFGSNTPMYTDLHHIYPTDKFVNNKRSNYPFGETNSPTYSSANGFSKLGPCSVSGYSGTVFEPADEYKGDFARTYFYMITCYEEKLHDWYTNYSSTDVVHVIDGSTYPGFQTWQLNMLLKWAKDDRVSDKEIARNTAVAGIQGNRNPFIDYPGLEQYIWGSKTTDTFSYDNYVQPTTWSTEYNSSGSGGGDPTPGGAGTYKLQQVTSVEAGEMYVFEQSGYVMNNTCSNSALQTTNTYNTTRLTGEETYVWTLESATNGYYMKNASAGGQIYLNNTSSTSVSFGTKNSIWAFNFQTNGTVLIQNKSNSDRFLGYTSVASHEYKAYATSNLSSSSYPHAIKVYKLVEEVTPSLITSDLALTGAPVALSFDLNTNSAAQVIHYTTSSTGAVTVSGGAGYVTTSVDTSNKTITVTPTTATPSIQTITVNQAADETYAAGTVTFTVTVDDSTPVPVSEGGYFTKITSLNDLESGGTYLIVYETGGKAFNGALTTLDADNNNINVTISNSRIEATTEVIAATFTITQKTGGYSVKSASGYYIGITSNNNSLKSSLTDSYTNTISFNKSTGNVFIEGRGSSPYYYLYFNASANRFRFYSSAQKEIQLYKYAPPSQTLNVSGAGYATMVAAANLEIPSGVEVFAVQVNAGNTAAHLEPITTAIPKDAAVVVKASEGSHKFNYASGTVSAISNNDLVAATTAVIANGTQYCLANKTSGIGFYKVKEGVEIPAGKAYLVVSGGNVKAFYGFEEDDATGISTMDKGQRTMDNVIYNVAGQRVDNSQFTIHNSQLKRGIYIVNGRKVMVK